MKFRFETLLQVHKNKENLLQKQLGDILAHKQKQQNRQDFLKVSRENEIKQVNQRMTQNLNIDTYFLYNMFFHLYYHSIFLIIYILMDSDHVSVFQYILYYIK